MTGRVLWRCAAVWGAGLICAFWPCKGWLVLLAASALWGPLCRWWRHWPVWMHFYRYACHRLPHLDARRIAAVACTPPAEVVLHAGLLPGSCAPVMMHISLLCACPPTLFAQTRALHSGTWG